MHSSPLGVVGMQILASTVLWQSLFLLVCLLYISFSSQTIDKTPMLSSYVAASKHTKRALCVSHLSA